MNQIAHLLRALGLDEKDLSIYALLVEQGPLTAREIAEKAGVPYTKVYERLQALSKLGFVEKLEGRPAKFSARPPAELYRSLVSLTSALLKSVKEFMDVLQTLYEAKHGAASTTFIALIRGDKIFELVQEIIRSSEVAVYLAVPYPELASPGIVETIVEESKRIEIKVLATKRIAQFMDLPPRVEVRALDDMFGGGVLGNSALLVVKHRDGLLGVHSNEKYLLEVAKTYFNYLWERAKA
ncbi:TrmB family transcriptional regulator [Thermoproteus tenax]|uniref:Transcriptional regulator n=1 Tax=Thermoproteus tenax (strain ATCC 35583 / DSM 2078 / JCM 9277 / NBRC 100435 / Kra 1) TaxID=768679 RepID=G4RPB7_THETK|nr:helix-turn-helix domain-containing protein [Thermoproteus tenax]CCC81412.1 transcriptional regulator [Thermoproteus tenax Kra 1]